MKKRVGFRKTKESKGTGKMVLFHDNKGGGEVGKIIIGPESSTGSTGKFCAHPHSEGANENAIQPKLGK